MANGHAKLSPSGADRWMLCPGSVAMCEGLPDTTSEYADEGTAAHYLAAHILNGNTPPVVDGFVVVNRTTGDCCFASAVLPSESSFKVQDLLPDVTTYVEHVNALTEGALEVMVEVELPISHLTGEEGATGTSDLIALHPSELVVADLKFGMGNRVDAENNRQLMIYGLAAIEEYGLLYDFDRVRLVISQPRLGHISEWVVSVEDLLAFGEEVKAAAATVSVIVEGFLTPGEKQCKWCKAKAKCPALAEFVQEAVGTDFEDLTAEVVTANVEYSSAESLSAKLSKVDLIETWCKAVRAAVEIELLAGREVPGYKLVQGKKGNRAWRNEDEAEELLKKMRVKHDQMYNYKLISPTTAEKLAKEEVIGKRQWPKVLELITQSEGKPSVAPVSDKRPALVIAQPSADDFENVDDDLI